MENLLERNPRMSFTDFWHHLASIYDRDTQAQLRVAWESVTLPSGTLTLDRWYEFIREFHLRRDRVEDRTPQEE